MKLRRRWKLLLLLLVLGGIGWGAGLVWFVSHLDDPPAGDIQTDAVVVLTGGSQRIEHGLALLTGGRARMLFVSGVPEGVLPNEMQSLRRDMPGLVACCIELGHAENTEENARETAFWVNGRGVRSLRLVTADYHMQRALVEFRRALPSDIVIVPDPVYPQPVSRSWLFHWQTAARIVLIEYEKYLGARVRAAILPGPFSASGTKTSAAPAN